MLDPIICCFINTGGLVYFPQILGYEWKMYSCYSTTGFKSMIAQVYTGGFVTLTIVGPHTRVGYLQIAHSCFTADSQSRLKDASGE